MTSTDGGRTEPKARAKRLSSAKRREHLLDVAAEILGQHGFEALTMESLVERAGVSKGLGYHHFKNAEQLAIAVYDRELKLISERIIAATSAAATVAERTKRGMGAYLDYVGERGVVFTLLATKLSGKGRGTFSNRVNLVLDMWGAQLAEEFCLEPHVARAIASTIFATADTLARAWHMGSLDRSEVESLVEHFNWGGLQACVKALGK